MTLELLQVSLNLCLLAFMQNIAFTIASRSRNRDNMSYLLVSAIFANSLWFVCVKMLVEYDLTLHVMPAYLLGTVSGTLFGARISMVVEKKLGARADSHIENTKQTK